MTFEEYKYLAENPQFPDRSAIFKVEVYTMFNHSMGTQNLFRPEPKKYYRKSMGEPKKYSETYCMTFEEAKQHLHNEMEQIRMRNVFEIYCAYIYQIPINENAIYFPYDRAWLYDHKGNLIDQSYCPLYINEEHFPFRGRPEYAIRFKRGDIVELLVDYCDRSKFVIVYNTPPDIERAYEMNNQLSKRGNCLDYSYDRYTVVDIDIVLTYKDDGLICVDPLRLIKPRFDPPKNVVKNLNQRLQKAIKNRMKSEFS